MQQIYDEYNSQYKMHIKVSQTIMSQPLNMYYCKQVGGASAPKTRNCDLTISQVQDSSENL